MHKDRHRDPTPLSLQTKGVPACILLQVCSGYKGTTDTVVQASTVDWHNPVIPM